MKPVSVEENVLGNAYTHVDSKLAKVRVELTRESQASCDTGHDNGHEVVEIAISGC